MILVMLVGAVAATAPRPTRAVTEVEAAGYAGETAGGWVCGPVGRARYGGAGAQARVSSREPQRGEGRGWTGSAAAAVERESVEIIACDNSDDTCDPSDEPAPPDSTLYAGRVRGGWHAEMVGIEAGASVYQAWDDPEDRRADVRVFPQLELKVGPDRIHGRLGVGDPFLTTLRRPGFYAALGLDLGERHSLDVGTSALRAGPGTPADHLKFRLDTIGRIAMGDVAHLRLGGAMWGPYETPRVEGELSLGLGARFE